MLSKRTAGIILVMAFERPIRSSDLQGSLTILLLDFGYEFLRVENSDFLLRLSNLMKEVGQDRE